MRTSDQQFWAATAKSLRSVLLTASRYSAGGLTTTCTTSCCGTCAVFRLSTSVWIDALLPFWRRKRGVIVSAEAKKLPREKKDRQAGGR